MTPATPPRLAIRLLESLLREEDRDAVVGDLIEESAIRARESSRASATWWCYRQVVRSIPPVLWSELRRGRWFETLSAAILVYIAASALESVGTSVVLELLHPGPRLATVLSVLVGLTTMVLGGYVAASIRQKAAHVLAGIIFIVVVVLFVALPGSAPLWYGLTFLLAGPLAALAGGWLNRTRRRRRAE